jgi:hypothetical protein
MKRVTHVTAAVALALLVISSQAEAQNKRAGINAGIDFASVSTNTSDDLSSKMGFSGGGFFGVDLAKMFRIQLNAQYVQKGTSFSELDIDFDINLNYIELLLPLTLLIPIEDSPITPRLYAGPSVAFETTCKLKASFEGDSVAADCVNEDVETDIQTKSTDFGVFFGGGVDFAVGSGEITLDVLYNLGLANVSDISVEDIEFKNRNLQILLGYAFLFGG